MAKLKALTIDGQRFDLTAKADLVNGKVPEEQLPSYVDDVLEFADLAAFPATGEAGKIYLAIDTGKIYRWGTTVFVEIPTASPLRTDELEFDITGTNIEPTSKLNVYKDMFGNINVFIYIKKTDTAVSTQAVTINLPSGYAPLANFPPFSTRVGVQFLTTNSTFNDPSLPIHIINNTVHISSIPHYQGTYDEFYSAFIVPKK